MAISPMKEAMLKQLARYKYLTTSQLMALDVSKSREKLREYFRELRNKRGFTGRQIYMAVSEKGAKQGKSVRVRYEDLHHLTKKGAKFLETPTDLQGMDIRYPKKPKPYLTNDYLHRVSTIWIHISFDRWVKAKQGQNQTLLYYKQWRTGKSYKFEAETRLCLPQNKTFSPDMICYYQFPNQSSMLYCLEVYNGDKVTYASQQLETLLWIIEKTRLVENRVGVKAIPRMLCVCDNEALLLGIQQRLKANPVFNVEHIEELLFFNIDRVVWEDFGVNWQNINGDCIDLSNVAHIKYR
jgi:hypothetical protein